MGARLGRRDCPQTRRVRSPLGAVTMVPPGGWSLVDNKRNTHTGETETIRNPLEIVRKGSISNHQIPSDFGWGLVKSILFEQARVDTSQYAPTKSLETSLFACGSRDRTTLATRSRPVHVDNKREHTHTHAHGMGSGGSAVDAMVIGWRGAPCGALFFVLSHFFAMVCVGGYVCVLSV